MSEVTKRAIEHILEGMGVCMCVYTVVLNMGMHVLLHSLFTTVLTRRHQLLLQLSISWKTWIDVKYSGM